MTHAKRLWSIWQALLSAFAWAFTGPSFRRFAEWVTAMAINGEEHTITQSVLALERPADWKALESFAEYGAWHPDYVTASLTRLVETAPGRLWHGYHISAVDDTKVHRNSPDVWGTCTFHEYTARCPNRAPTVRAHNWVMLGTLLDNPGQPPWCLPLSGRLYFRKSQLPLQSQDSDHTVVFRTKCELVVELIREQARITGGRHLGIFDGAYALRSVVRPLVQPEPGHPRIEFLTRLRPDARLYALPPPGCRANQKWGRRLPPRLREISPFKRHFSRHRRGPHHELSEVYQVSAGCGPGLIGRPERPHALGHVPRISEDHGAPSGPQPTARRSGCAVDRAPWPRDSSFAPSTPRHAPRVACAARSEPHSYSARTGHATGSLRSRPDRPDTPPAAPTHRCSSACSPCPQSSGNALGDKCIGDARRPIGTAPWARAVVPPWRPSSSR